jgi:hypothetical protein
VPSSITARPGSIHQRFVDVRAPGRKNRRGVPPHCRRKADQLFRRFALESQGCEERCDFEICGASRQDVFHGNFCFQSREVIACECRNSGEVR